MVVERLCMNEMRDNVSREEEGEEEERKRGRKKYLLISMLDFSLRQYDIKPFGCIRSRYAMYQ